ncbi:Zinc finger bed domain-containing protein ricesleeper [Thalictrum thalictroides]|uniref:Zinc finger bed domain-containing protein ricesleeper n=1 Tax=Thalictrum thalictroides TaxID=46969 RepID=A0A7J6X2V5_THATH|nr:Zinc finger bed domain-containing protein ricesleeper [Thalictrum thalictroides]
MSKIELLLDLAIYKYGWDPRHHESYGRGLHDTEPYRSILANNIINGKISLKMLEQEDYLRFLKHKVPELKMLSIDDIKSDYLTRKTELLRVSDFKKKRTMKEMLARAGTGKFCLMVDTWKSEQPGLENVRILVKYIAREEYGQKSWKLEELMLSLRQLQSPLNDDDLTEAILLCLSEWDIEDKISTITFMNSSCYDSVAARVRNHLNKKKALPLDGKLFHVCCSKGILNSMVQLAMNEVYDVVNELPKDRFGSFELEEWDSAYQMLEQALRHSELYLRSHYKDVLTKGESKKVEGTFSLIKLIKNLADTCSPKKTYPTTCFHILLVFRKQLVKESTSSDKFVSELANKMLLLFNRFWDDMFMIMAMVMVIDPHFKLKYLEFFFSKYSDSDAKTSVELVRDAMSDLYSEYMSDEQLKKANVPCDEPSAEQVEKANDPCDEELFDDSNVSDSWLDEYFEATIPPEPKSYLSDYFDKDLLIQPSLSYDVLSWWKYGEHDPTLSRMACDILAIGIYDFKQGTEEKDWLNRNDMEIYISKLAELIYLDCLPFVKDENFLALVDPDFKMVKMENVKTQILETYKRWKENVKKFLVGDDDYFAKWSGRDEKEKSPNRISLAIDKWRSTQGREFLCVTAHFIDCGWKFKKLILSFFEVSVPMTVDNVTEKILRCISSWGIGEKILSITLRNSFIYEETSLRLQNCLREKIKLPFDGMFFRVHCCSDIFNEIAQQGLNEISEIIDKFHEVTPDNSLQNLQNDRQWDVTYLLLRKAIETRKTCSTSGVADTEILSIDEWKKVEGICRLLKGIYDVESILSRTKQTTANDYFHYVCVVRAVLTQQSIGSDIFVSTIAKKMLERLDKYWKDMFMVLAIASFLDPMFRMKYLEYVLPKCADIDSSTLVTQVHEAVSCLYTEYKVTDVKPTPAANLRENNFPYCHINNGDKLNDALLKEYHDFVESQNTRD